MAAGALPHRFRMQVDDLKRLIDKTRFAISTEETRFYLNGIYLHAAKEGKTKALRAAATDGHRLARFELDLPDGAADMPGVIVPRKTVTELRRLLDDAEGAIDVSLSDTKIQFITDGVELTSKLIDGTFPDYQRVIPSGNDKALSLDSEGIRAGGGPRVHHLGRQDPRGEAQHRQGQADAHGRQSGFRHGDGRARRDLQRGPHRDRLQCPLSARHHRPDRRQGGALPAVGCGLAHDHRGHGGRAHALRPHADAGVSLTSAFDPECAPGRSMLRCEPSRAAACGDASAADQFPLLRPGELRTSGRPVVLAGPNGAGKTNMLDAISLLSPGARPARRQPGRSYRKGPAVSEGDALWAVAATVARAANSL
jgi:hypothetical protein